MSKRKHNGLTRDPVRVTWVAMVLIEGIVAVLLIADAISDQTGGIVTAIILLVFAAVSELFVHHETVPLADIDARVDQSGLTALRSSKTPEAPSTAAPEHPEGPSQHP